MWRCLVLAGGITPLFAQYPCRSHLVAVPPTPVPRAGQCAPASERVQAHFCIGCYDVCTGEWLDCETQFSSTFNPPSEDDPYWTGGHFHTDSSRPIGQLICNAMDTHDAAYTEFGGRTRHGEWDVTKTMPEVSGVITVSATYVAPWNYRCAPDDLFTCGPSNPRVARGYFGFDVGYTGLVELPPWPEVYVRCGLTASCICDNTSPTHPSAFWGTREMVAAVEDLAVSFQALHPGLRLRITDMSLPRGGLFDLNLNWRAPEHCRHRTGTSVDISKYALTIENPRTVSLPIDELIRLAFRCHLGRVPEATIHFELHYGGA